MTHKTKPTIDLGYPTPAHGQIPSFHNVEEEAAFWDSHNITDFQAELERVEIRVVKQLSDPHDHCDVMPMDGIP